jgi:hypothetical protein
MLFAGTFGFVGIAPCYNWPVATVASFSRLSDEIAVLSSTSRAHAELNKLYLEELSV